MSEEEEAFIATIGDARDEITPRLVYADWLDEHDEATRAEYLRVASTIAQLSESDRSLETLCRQLRLLAEQIPRSWRDRVGFEYRVLLDWFDPGELITVVRLLRMKFSLNLAEATAATRTLPVELPMIHTREEADEVRFTFETGFWSLDSSHRNAPPRLIPLCHVRIERAR